LIWHWLKCHIIIQLLFFSNCGVINWFFFKSCRDKYTWHVKKIKITHTHIYYIYHVLSTNVFASFTTTICTCLYTTFVHDESMYIYTLYTLMHTSIKVWAKNLMEMHQDLTTKSLHEDFNNIYEKYIFYYFWHEIV